MFAEKCYKSFKIIKILKKGQKLKMHAPEFEPTLDVNCRLYDNALTNWPRRYLDKNLCISLKNRNALSHLVFAYIKLCLTILAW